jgi:hypothetical protein
MTVFIISAYAIAPLLGGIVWARAERLDQSVQVLPFLLILWFVTPVLLEVPGFVKRTALVATCITSILYTTLSLAVGVSVVRENLGYRGTTLSEADVPLVEKLDVVRFIAEDWKAHSPGSPIPVDYDLGGERWNWVPGFGMNYLEWYPAPYTMGRVFDYLFLREYGLYNRQEGKQVRAFGIHRYLINYSFEASPEVLNRRTREYIFGRLRVTIVGPR